MILSNVVSYVAQVGVLLAVGLLAPRVLGLRKPAVSLRYWQALLLAVLLLPFLQPWQDPSGGSVTVQTVGFVVTESVAAAVPESVPGRAALWIAVVVGGVAALRLAWIGFGLWTLRRMRRSACRIDRVPEVVAEIRNRLGVDAELMESRHVRVPVTFGWRRPAVLVPPRFGGLPENQQTGVVCHELLHVGRGDWLTGVFEQIVRAVLWFHPGVSILLGRIALSREQLVDAEVVRITGDRRGYLDALWSMARRGEQSTIVPALPLLNRSDLFERVAVLTEEVNMSKRRILAIVAAAVVSVAVAGAAVAAAFPLMRAAESALDASVPSADTGAFPMSSPATDTGASPTSSARKEPVRFEADGDITEPIIIHKVNPKYPEEARKNKVMGEVVCEAVITAEGKVADVKIVETDDEIFNQATIDAIEQWEFEPATLDGEPVDVYYNLTVRFSLK